MAVNPARGLPHDAFEVVQRWATWRDVRAWPDRGGLNDQSAWLLDAFGILSAATTKER